MKRCLECRRTFTNNTLTDCLNDGTPLVEDAPAPPPYPEIASRDYSEDTPQADFEETVPLAGSETPRFGRLPLAVSPEAMHETPPPYFAAQRRRNEAKWLGIVLLCKDLLIDWRVGAEYYMQELVDGDWAANYGGWQWVAGTAPDPNGNFRVFNPVAQQRRYDPNLTYCRRWIPELDTAAYPKPMVDHARAGEEFIRRFQKAYGPRPGGRR